MPVYEGQTKVHFAPTVANINVPTVAEITGGTNLSPFLTKDGVQPPTSQNMVDTADIETVYDAQEPGSWGGPFVLKMKRKATDTAWNLFTHGLAGFLVISYDNWGGNGTVGAGDKVQVYPIKAHHPVMSPSATNEEQRFTVNCAVTGEPALKATVA